jgi:hypothetical protein
MTTADEQALGGGDGGTPRRQIIKLPETETNKTELYLKTKLKGETTWKQLQ